MYMCTDKKWFSALDSNFQSPVLTVDLINRRVIALTMTSVIALSHIHVSAAFPRRISDVSVFVWNFTFVCTAYQGVCATYV